MSALALAERALAAAPRADGSLARVVRERSLLLRFARSRPTQATGVDDLDLELAVLRDGHVGRAVTNRTDDDALAEAGRRAAATAEAAARQSGGGPYPGFPQPRKAPMPEPDNRAPDPEPGGAALRTVFAAAEASGVEAHGVWTAGDVETAVASSAGAPVAEHLSDAHLKVVCIAPGGRSGYAATTATGVHSIDPAAVAERAARKAAAVGDPVRVDPGQHEVVLAPHAVGVLLDALGDTAFDGLAHAEGRGALAGRLGERVVSPQVNLADSPRFPGTLQRGFDAEGVAKRPLPLIQDGVAHGVVHDARSAAAADAESTGHALAPGGSAAGPAPTNLVLTGGGAGDEAELCAPVERGLYVTRLWYLNVVRPKETLVTAVTRDGTFLIEDGEVTRPAADMRLTDGVLGMLSRVQALGARPVLTSEAEFYGRRFAYGVTCPAIRVAAVTLRP